MSHIESLINTYGLKRKNQVNVLVMEHVRTSHSFINIIYVVNI